MGFCLFSRVVGFNLAVGYLDVSLGPLGRQGALWLRGPEWLAGRAVTSSAVVVAGDVFISALLGQHNEYVIISVA